MELCDTPHGAFQILQTPKSTPWKEMLIPSFIKKQANYASYGRIRSVSLSWQTMVIAVSPRNRSAARRVRLDIVSKKNPSIVNDYNKYMGGCDLAGQLCKYHRTLKWWKRLFVTILDICLLNATIVYNSIPTNSRLSLLEFRVKMIEGLLSTWKYNPAQHANQLSSSRPSSQHPHFPGRSGNKRNCVVCSTK